MRTQLSSPRAQIISGVLYMLRPHTMVTLGLSLVSVWFCAPSRLALAWDANFQMIVVGLVFPMSAWPPARCAAHARF